MNKYLTEAKSKARRHVARLLYVNKEEDRPVLLMPVSNSSEEMELALAMGVDRRRLRFLSRDRKHLKGIPRDICFPIRLSKLPEKMRELLGCAHLDLYGHLPAVVSELAAFSSLLGMGSVAVVTLSESLLGEGRPMDKRLNQTYRRDAVKAALEHGSGLAAREVAPAYRYKNGLNGKTPMVILAFSMEEKMSEEIKNLVSQMQAEIKKLEDQLQRLRSSMTCLISGKPVESTGDAVFALRPAPGEREKLVIPALKKMSPDGLPVSLKDLSIFLHQKEGFPQKNADDCVRRMIKNGKLREGGLKGHKTVQEII